MIIKYRKLHERDVILKKWRMDDNDLNAIKNMGMLPEGYTINHFLTDTDAFFIKTDDPWGSF